MDDVRYIILPGDLRKEERLTLGHVKIAMVLGAYSKRQGWTDLTQDDVGEMAGLARQTVCRLVGELVDWGWVDRRKKAGKNQYVYRFIMDREDCQLEVTVPQKHCQPQVTGTVTSNVTFNKEDSSTLSQSTSGASAPATQGAARSSPAVKRVYGSLEVKSTDISWLRWLDKIEETQGTEARSHVQKQGFIRVPERWPMDGVPIPVINVPRNPAGSEA